MELLSDAIKLLKPQVWMAKVDLKDAFYSIPVHIDYQKFFKFEWDLKYFKFTGMPNGYCEAMRLFTKIMKVPFSVLRENGHLSVVFVDDSLLQGDTKEECSTNVSETINLLRKLGFTVNIDESIFIPTQILEFLRFLLNSTDMTVSLSNEKKDSLKLKIYKFFLSKSLPLEI